MDIQDFMHCSVDGHLGCFHLLPVMNNAAINIHVQVLYGRKFSFLLGIYLGIELLGHVVTMFNYLMNCQTHFQSYYIILHYHKKCLRVPIFPHPCQ